MLQPPADVSAAYLCVFQRDVSSKPDPWEDHWPTVEKMLADFADIRTVLALCWPKQEREPFNGVWLTEEVPAEYIIFPGDCASSIE